MLHEKSDNKGDTDSSEDGNLYDSNYISENMAGLQITAFGFCSDKFLQIMSLLTQDSRVNTLTMFKIGFNGRGFRDMIIPFTEF